MRDKLKNVKKVYIQKGENIGMDNESIKKKKDHLIDVQPIRDLQKLEDMKWSLQRFCGKRDYILFLIGINTGLRVSDIIKLKAKEIKGKKAAIIKEGKTDKPRKIMLENIYNELNDYIKDLDSIYLFPSRKGNKPISAIQAYRQIVKAANMIELDSVGTHTMRKTFGYWHYKQFKDVAALQSILNHSHPQITLKYIGITSEEIEENLKGFKL
jgi:integrase